MADEKKIISGVGFDHMTVKHIQKLVTPRGKTAALTGAHLTPLMNPNSQPTPSASTAPTSTPSTTQTPAKGNDD